VDSCVPVSHVHDVTTASSRAARAVGTRPAPIAPTRVAV
jgi:hypothetical protein